MQEHCFSRFLNDLEGACKGIFKLNTCRTVYRKENVIGMKKFPRIRTASHHLKIQFNQFRNFQMSSRKNRTSVTSESDHINPTGSARMSSTRLSQIDLKIVWRRGGNK